MTSPRAYLDHNAATPLRPEARDAMLAAFGCVGNPSSVHAEGRAARAIVEGARETVAAALGVKSASIVFTSGGTEAANTLLAQAKSRLLIGAGEHSCVREGHGRPAQAVETLGLGANGVLDVGALERALPGEAATVAVQAANNETGVVQPIEEIARLAHASGAVLVCDAVQAIGRAPYEAATSGADAVFFSSHKFGGPKGVGAIVLRNGEGAFEPFIRGGGQERRRRSGTENVAGIAGLAAALTAALAGRESFEARTRAWQSALEAGVRSIAPDAVIFGEAAPRLPNTTFFAVPGLRAETGLIAFDLDGVAVSSGSACSSGRVARSHVLDAMGAPVDLGSGAIRVSTGWTGEDADIERFLTVLAKICSNRRERRAA